MTCYSGSNQRRNTRRVRHASEWLCSIYACGSPSEPKWRTSPHLQPRGTVAPLHHRPAARVNRTRPLCLVRLLSDVGLTELGTLDDVLGENPAQHGDEEDDGDQDPAS